MKNFKLSPSLRKTMEGSIKNNISKKIKPEETILNELNNTLSDLSEQNKTKVIKTNNKFTKHFRKSINIDKSIFTKPFQEQLSKELISYVKENGYIKLKKGFLSYKNNSLVIINKD